MAKITLGYWDIRGLAQPIRTLLEYTETPYEDIRYSFGDPPNYERRDWLDVKFKLGLAFPNLPYLVDGDLKLTESSAILRHLARKTHLIPEKPEDLAKVEMLEGVLNGVRIDFLRTLHQDLEKLKPDLEKRSQEKIKLVADYLSDQKFLTGDNLCYVDFLLYDVLDIHRLLFCDILDGFPNLKSYLERFRSVPKISEYFNSGRYKVFPIPSPFAKWGFKKPE